MKKAEHSRAGIAPRILHARGSTRLLGVIAVAILATVLGWRSVAINLAEDLALEQPALALTWNARQPDAWYTQAYAALSVDPEAAERYARESVRVSPADGRGYGILARAADAQGRTDQAKALYRIGLRLSPRDAPTRAAFANFLLRHDEPDGAVDQLIALDWLRARPGFSTHQDLLRIADLPGGAAIVGARIAAIAPPWREYFMTQAFGAVKDGKSADRLYAALNAAAIAPTAKERKAYLDRLIYDRRFFEAWALWVDGLGADRKLQLTNLYNGAFELPLSDSPFDWQIASIAGAASAVVDSGEAGGGKALQIDFFDQRVPFAHVQQVLLLAPGSYRLSGRVKLDELQSARGLRWAIGCSPLHQAYLGESEHFSGSRPWGAFEVEFSVPATGCDAQVLRLETAARVPIEAQIAGRIAFDDLSIKRNVGLTAQTR